MKTKYPLRAQNQKFVTPVLSKIIVLLVVYGIFTACWMYAALIGVSVRENSQISDTPPGLSTNSSATVPFPERGIGLIVKPTWTMANDHTDFALHQNNGIQPSPLFVAPHVPDPEFVTVTYLFDQPQIVRAVNIVQHVLGVTSVQGFIGNSTNSTVSLGPVFGPAGDITSGFVAAEGEAQLFDFGNTNVAGTVFQLVVRKTVHDSAFAVHRIFPLNVDLSPVCISSGPLKARIQVSRVRINWNADCDKTYQVQRTSNLATNDWADYGLPMLGTTNWIEDEVTSSPMYYRIVRATNAVPGSP